MASTAASRRDEIWEAKRLARAAPPPRVVPGQQFQAQQQQQQQQVSPRQPATFRSNDAPMPQDPAGPPAPGQDPDFDRRVQEQLAKMRAQRMGIPQVAAPPAAAAAALPYDRYQQQQHQYSPPAAPRFDDDVASEMRALEQQLRASTSGRLSPPRQQQQQQQQQRASPPRGRHSQQYEQSEADNGGFMAQLESHRRSPGSFGKGKGLRYMHDPGPHPAQQQQQQQQQQPAPFHGDDSRSRGSAVAAAAQYRQQQQQQQEWPQQQAGPQRQGPGLKGMWEAHDPAAAQARHRGKTEYHRALDAQRAEASQLAATADNSSSGSGRGTLRQSLYSQQQQQPYHSRTPLSGGGGTSVAGTHSKNIHVGANSTVAALELHNSCVCT
jgi:hypothetical protein